MQVTLSTCYSYWYIQTSNSISFSIVSTLYHGMNEILCRKNGRFTGIIITNKCLKLVCDSVYFKLQEIIITNNMEGGTGTHTHSLHNQIITGVDYY